MSAPTLEQLAALPATVERLAARVAELEAKLQHAVAADELITVEQAAAEIGVSEQSIYKSLQRGRLRRYTVGATRSVRVRRGDLAVRR